MCFNSTLNNQLPNDDHCMLTMYKMHGEWYWIENTNNIRTHHKRETPLHQSRLTRGSHNFSALCVEFYGQRLNLGFELVWMARLLTEIGVVGI